MSSVIHPTSRPPKRDEATFLLALCEEPARIVPNGRIVHKIWNAYIRVDDVESIYAEVQERGAGYSPLWATIASAPSRETPTWPRTWLASESGTLSMPSRMCSSASARLPA